MTQEEVHGLLERTGALASGHFIADDGRHVELLIRPAKALQFAPFNRKLCFEIVRHFYELDVHVVISPTIGGIPVAVEVGRQLEARAVFMEEIDGKPGLGRGFQLHDGERAIVVLDHLLHNDQLKEAIAQIRGADARLIGVGAIVDTRGVARMTTVKDVAAIQLPLQFYSASECPMCAAGAPITQR